MAAEPVPKKFKAYDFRPEWEHLYFCSMVNLKCVCLICPANLGLPDITAIETHYNTRHKNYSQSYPIDSDMRKSKVSHLKESLGLSHLHNFKLGYHVENLQEMKDLSSTCDQKVDCSFDPNITMSNVVPAIGKPAPQFKGTAVVDGEFKEISLSDYKGKYVVFFFYPLDFTFVCPTEIIAFSDRVKEFKKIGCEVIGCSTDSHFSHLAWINTSRKEGGLGHMNIPLLADKSMEISKSYGVLKEDDGVSFRGLFLIDRQQNLRQVTINDLPVGRDVDETLRLVQAFQFTDEHGEVCPAGWKPGSKSMKADPLGSKDYFSSQN